MTGAEWLKVLGVVAFIAVILIIASHKPRQHPARCTRCLMLKRYRHSCDHDDCPYKRWRAF